MKTVKFLTLILVSGFLTTTALAGNVEKGKKLFNNPKLSSATAGKSCNSCHQNGAGIDASKKEFMGGKAKSLEEAINLCLVMMMKGKALDPKGQDMADLVAYLKSLKPTPSAPKKKKIEGC